MKRDAITREAERASSRLSCHDEKLKCAISSFTRRNAGETSGRLSRWKK